MSFVVRSLLVICAVSLVTSAADAKPLTMRSAERAIDRGLEAELAGDAAGAEKSLLEVIALATATEETAPRERIQAFVRSLSARRDAFAQHGKTARAYARAYDTMLPFGLERAERLWVKAVADVPALGSAPMPKVAVRLDLLKGAEEKAVMVELERAMKRYGFELADPKSARFVVRVNLDATGVKRDPRGVRVFAEASAVVSDRQQPKNAAGSMSKARS